MLRLYFVRHGESEANLLNIFSNRGYKHPLTTRGREQVALLADNLMGAQDVPFLAIYSSPLLRAVQSAQILSRRMGIPYESTPALAEYDVGVYEGRSDEEGWRRYGEVLREWLINRNFEARMEEGESFKDIEARFIPFMDALRERHGRQHGSIVLVGHGGTFRCMLPLVLSNADFSLSAKNMIDNTSYVQAELRDDTFICSKWGDISFKAEA
jgi:broad specificity phosphatase PhoE